MKKIYAFSTLMLLSGHYSFASLTSEKLNSLIAEAEAVMINSESSDKADFSAKFTAIKSTDINSEQKLTETENELQSLIRSYVVKAQPVNGYAFDYTFLMVNPELSEYNVGWTETPTIGYGEAEIYNRTYDMYQILRDMPEGNYQLNVQGFYRQSMWYNGIVNEANSGCAIYGNEQVKPLVTLYQEPDAQQFRNNAGGYANSMYDASLVFAQGFYTGNAVNFYQSANDDMQIGIRNTGTANGNWTCFKNFTLKYLGNSGEKAASAYRISCPNYGDGSIMPGSYAGNDYPVYYSSSVVNGEEGYWYLTEEEKGKYSIRNAANGKYITWDGERIESSKRYMDLTDRMFGDSSLWTLNKVDDANFCIRNVYNPEELWDTRSGSQMVGTYTNSGTPNNYQKYMFYDAMGELITEFNATWLNKGIKNITFNGSPVAYNQLDKNYLAGVALDVMDNGSFEAVVNYTKNEGWSNLYIDGKEVASGDTYTFSGIFANYEFVLSVKDEMENESESYLSFTGLPIVQINGNFSPEYSKGSIRVYEPGKEGADTLMNARIRWRGASTLSRNKKQYAVKLYDPDGKSMDASFFGLRNDNNWILDGMSIDVARMRNRVCTDLMQSYAAKPYYYEEEPNMINGTRGHFVEVFLNDQYVGIYCMTERMDRKQLKLKKYDEAKNNIRGLLWKGKEWSYSIFMGHDYNSNYYPMKSPVMYSNDYDTWDGYEMEYPDLSDGEPISWGELYDAVNFVCTAPDAEFVEGIADYFDMPVLMDYYIFMETILSSDNHGKNMFFFVYNRNKDKKISFGPWDLDSTFGRRWNSTTIAPDQDYTDYITVHEHGDYNLFKRVKELNVNNFQDSVRYRYKELRSAQLHTDTIIKRFTDYKDMFDISGASRREENRWTNTDAGTLNFDNEMEYLSNWVTTRMNYLDDMWNIAELPEFPNIPSGIEVVTPENGIESIGVGRNGVIIKCSTSVEIAIYNTSGQLVRKTMLSEGVNEIPLQKGVYIINGRKIVVL